MHTAALGSGEAGGSQPYPKRKTEEERDLQTAKIASMSDTTSWQQVKAKTSDRSSQPHVPLSVIPPPPPPPP